MHIQILQYSVYYISINTTKSEYVAYSGYKRSCLAQRFVVKYRKNINIIYTIYTYKCIKTTLLYMHNQRTIKLKEILRKWAKGTDMQYHFMLYISYNIFYMQKVDEKLLDIKYIKSDN